MLDLLAHEEHCSVEYRTDVAFEILQVKTQTALMLGSSVLVEVYDGCEDPSEVA